MDPSVTRGLILLLWLTIFQRTPRRQEWHWHVVVVDLLNNFVQRPGTHTLSLAVKCKDRSRVHYEQVVGMKLLVMRS